jgi:hypothetical protein
MIKGDCKMKKVLFGLCIFVVLASPNEVLPQIIQGEFITLPDPGTTLNQGQQTRNAFIAEQPYSDDVQLIEEWS